MNSIPLYLVVSTGDLIEPKPYGYRIDTPSLQLSTAKGFKDKSDHLKAVVLTLLRTIKHSDK